MWGFSDHQMIAGKDFQGKEPLIHHPDEEIHQVFEDISLSLDRSTKIVAQQEQQSEELLKNGTLYATTKRLIWMATGNDDSSMAGFAWNFHDILLHAVSRDVAAFPTPCIYCQLDGEDETREFRLIPQDENKLESLYDALSYCAMLNPDEENDEGEEEGEGDGWIYNVEEMENAQRQGLDFRGPQLVVEGQFDDADEAEDVLL